MEIQGTTNSACNVTETVHIQLLITLGRMKYWRLAHLVSFILPLLLPPGPRYIWHQQYRQTCLLSNDHHHLIQLGQIT